MTWLDITVIVIWLIFLAIGARLGSVWTGACVIGGFFGSFLCDTYAVSLAGLFGDFRGAVVVSAFLLFLVGMAVVLIPGWFLSRITSAILLGVVDSAFGLFTGGVVGLVGISLILMFVVPIVPKVEKGQAWRKSIIVKYLYHKLENAFGSPKFRPLSFGKSLTDKLAPLTQSALDQAKKTAGRWEKILKK